MNLNAPSSTNFLPPVGQSGNISALAQNGPKSNIQATTGGVKPTHLEHTAPVEASAAVISPARAYVVRVATSDDDLNLVKNFITSMDEDTFRRRFAGQFKTEGTVGTKVEHALKNKQLLCFSGDSLVGVAAVGDPYDSKARAEKAYIDLGAAVSPEFQGKGAAKALINAAIQFGKDNGYAAIRVEQTSHSHAAVNKLIHNFDFKMISYGRESFFELKL